MRDARRDCIAVRERRNAQQEPEMFACIPENVSTWSGDWRIVTTTGNTLPPRDPDDDDADDDEEEGDDETDEEPAVVREPDE
jgi:hypothetical protein